MVALGVAVPGEEPEFIHNAILQQANVGSFLKNLKGTPNSLMVFAQNTGVIFSTSLNDNAVELDEEANRPHTLSTTPNTVIRAAGVRLADFYKSTDKGFKSIATDFTSSGSRYLMNVRHITDVHGLDVLLILIIPENDFLGTLKGAQTTAIGITVGISIAIIIAAIGIVFMITRPISLLVGTMQKASKFDFSDLNEQGFRSARSNFKEIAAMQDIFFEMLTKFANAITNSRYFVYLL